jgi:endonuclease/exonuclease/phosphatase family metal-dependent hydrolase
MVRIASFNVENLFARPRALNMPTWAQGRPILEAYEEFNRRIAKAVYTASDRARLIDLLVKVDVYRRTNGIVHRNPARNPRWAFLRANRGSFDVDREATGIEIVASGRGSWIGWLELATETVDETAIHMTARVINDVAADIVAVVEAEDRPALDRFNTELLASRYGHCMLIDGNDPRGIDVGVMTVPAIDIVEMRSNVDVADPVSGDQLFGRDCPQYRFELASGADLWLLVNHFKSQSGGGGGPKRARQAAGVRSIVDGLIAAGAANVVVLGDLNEGNTSSGQPSANLGPLLDADGPLVDVATLPAFDPGPRPGTFQSCSHRNRLDYILVSPALVSHVTGGGVERRGLWGTPTNVNPPGAWPIYPDLVAARHAASDHAAIYIDLDL